MNRYIRWIVVLLAIAAFVLSLTLPVYSCGPRGYPLQGYGVALMGPMGMLNGDFRWLGNPLFVFVTVDVLSGALSKSWIGLLASVATVTIAVSCLLVMPHACGENGGARAEELLVGGYVWCFALLAVSVCALSGWRIKQKG